MQFYGDDSEERLMRQKASVPEHYRIAELAISGQDKAIAELLKGHIRTWKPLFLKGFNSRGRSRIRLEPRI